MKYTSSSRLFDSEVSQINSCFSKWSSCKRVIAIGTLLKQLNYPELRFTQSRIEQIIQSTCSDEMKWIEQQSNNKSHIKELCDSYDSLSIASSDVQLSTGNNQDSMYIESDRSIINENTTNYSSNNNNINTHNLNHYNNISSPCDKSSKKEEILNNMINYILTLKAGNEETTQLYFKLLPRMVEDAGLGIIDLEIAQHILSVLVAHPALSSQDRGKVKDYIEMLYRRLRIQNELNTSWQTIAPPSVFRHSLSSILMSSSSSVASSHQVQSDIFNADCDTKSEFECGGSVARTSGGASDFNVHADINASTNLNTCLTNAPATSTESMYGYCTPDDHHVSFSKNGTEIVDYDQDLKPCPSQYTDGIDYLPVPFIDHGIQKTRRSNSLTTGSKYNTILLNGYTSSTENLAAMMHKQRSCSLIDHPRMASSGSDNCLNVYQAQKPGMSYVFAWLKSLRLHKYNYVFENFTYEQTMNVNEQYLAQLNVTKGARDKLVNCIQKLHNRCSTLIQTENDLINNKITLVAAVDILNDILTTPMKPIEEYNPTDVGSKFLDVLTLVCKILACKKIVPQDEEAVNKLLNVLEIALLKNNEVFMNHLHEVKGLLFDVEQIALKVPPKSHYHKISNGLNNGNLNKPRYTTSSKPHNKNGNDNKKNRKNSNPTYNFGSIQSQSKQHKSHGASHMLNKALYSNLGSGSYHPVPSSSYKSSSYPNFSKPSSDTSSCGSTHGQHCNGNGVGGQNNNQQHSYHSHSASNLITVHPNKNATLVAAKGSAITAKSLNAANSIRNDGVSIRSNSTSGANNYGKQASTKSIFGDTTSPYCHLEFLSLQMTEQAIN